MDATISGHKCHKLLVSSRSYAIIRRLNGFCSLPLVLQNSVGLSNNLARLLAACNSVSYLVFSFAGLVLIERAGRRKLMIWGAAGQCVCYIFISGLLSQTNSPTHGVQFGAGATAFFFLYYVFFGICWQVSAAIKCCSLPSMLNILQGSALAISNGNQ